MLTRQVVEGVPQEVDVTALVGGLGEPLADGGPEAGVVVGDDELDAMEAAGPKREQEVLPGGTALAVGHLDGEDLAAAVPIDTDGDQYRLAHHHAGLAHLLVAGVEDEVGEGLSERATGKGGEALVQPLVDRRDGRGREGVAAELLGDRLDLPGRDALHVHLRQGGHQRPLRALVTLKQLGREATLPVLRHPQLELANPGDESRRL